MTPRPLLSALILVTLLASLTSGCSKRTYIKTTPVGATATLDDGRELEKTPILLEEDIWVWTHHTITLTKPGYKPQELTLTGKVQAANIAVCAIGVCIMWLGWPLCVAGQYGKTDYNITLQRAANFEDISQEEVGAAGRIDSSSPGVSFRAQPRPH